MIWLEMYIIVLCLGAVFTVAWDMRLLEHVSNLYMYVYIHICLYYTNIYCCSDALCMVKGFTDVYLP